MEYRPLGRSGIPVSALCLGAMNFGDPSSEEESYAILDAAFEAGITFIDVANVYAGGESERIVGRWLASRGRRHQVVLATKAGMPLGRGPHERGFSRLHLVQACDDSLRRLQVEAIDLYQLHRPPLDVPQDEALRALDDLVRSGKVRHLGSSTHPAWLLMESVHLADRHGLTNYVSEQPPYNLLDRRIEHEIVPFCRRYGLALLPWSPLGGGILAGRYTGAGEVPADSRAARRAQVKDRITDRALEVASGVRRLAAEAGLTPSQLALLWVKEQPGITAPIIGPRTVEQLHEMVAIADQRLDADLATALDGLVPPGGAAADFFNTSGWMRRGLPG